MPSSRPRPIAVLFDLDGTLVDTIQLLLESVRYAFRERETAGLRVPTEAEWVAGIGTPLATQLRPYVSDDEELRSPYVEGDATAAYLTRMLVPMGLTVTRLASGLPVGGDLEYADEVTLGRAFAGRRSASE